jgi:alpha-beta hydrolase superfamily lysophospholipase
VVSTVVRRRAPQPTGQAVLYVHGFVDYFFQTHLADFYCERGLDFYALDLRKYGRSLRDHQTPNFVTSLATYSAEVDEAVRLIRTVDGHDSLLVNGHSTGGLITALWAHHRRGNGVVDGLFLNSPFLDLNAGWATRNLSTRGVEQLARARPHAIVPTPVSEHYVHSLHREHRGSWDFHLPWKPAAGFGVYAGWLAAIRRGQRKVARGLAIDVPVLSMSSTHSVTTKHWDERIRSADVVLDAERIARLAPRLGHHVTIVRIHGGMHDLVLSADAARRQVFNELETWLQAYLPR